LQSIHSQTLRMRKNGELHDYSALVQRSNSPHPEERG